MGGLGFGLPAAAGAKAACPDRPVICLTGDGGFQFNIQELGTCAQYGLHPIVLVFNDNAWGVIRYFQKTKMGGRTMASELPSPDFAKLAEAYGVAGVRVATLEALVDALQSAPSSGRMTVIDVATPEGFAAFA